MQWELSVFQMVYISLPQKKCNIIREQRRVLYQGGKRGGEGREKDKEKQMKINSDPTVGENKMTFSQWFVEKSETQEILSYGKQITFFMCIFL